jgi:hypothetical protein
MSKLQTTDGNPWIVQIQPALLSRSPLHDECSQPIFGSEVPHLIASVAGSGRGAINLGLNDRREQESRQGRGPRRVATIEFSRVFYPPVKGALPILRVA